MATPATSSSEMGRDGGAGINDAASKQTEKHSRVKDYSSPTKAQHEIGETSTPKKPNKVVQLWNKLGMDVPTVLMMMK